jgi:hypothetical protein
MIKNIIIILVAALISCTLFIEKKYSYVLSYKDFGPQVISNEIIGMEWWQWQNHGDSRQINYDIKVIVYRDIDLRTVKEKYPTDSMENKDYRYIKYYVALAYLDKHIDENVIEELTNKLKLTKKMITNILGSE